MKIAKWVREGMVHPRPAIYLKVVAVFALLGALSHLGSIMGMRGSWVDKPLQFLIGDPLLLLVDLVLAWGLWRTSCVCQVLQFRIKIFPLLVS
jgi:hypothetical protein